MKSPLEFDSKIVSMGDQKKIIIIPKKYWKLIEREKLEGELVKVTVEKL